MNLSDGATDIAKRIGYEELVDPTMSDREWHKETERYMRKLLGVPKQHFGNHVISIACEMDGGCDPETIADNGFAVFLEKRPDAWRMWTDDRGFLHIEVFEISNTNPVKNKVPWYLEMWFIADYENYFFDVYEVRRGFGIRHVLGDERGTETFRFFVEREVELVDSGEGAQ